MSAWLVAGSLDQLLAQLNALAPNRSKASDGAIGDAAHATRDSDHNPWLVIAGQPYVSARDYTHDPAGGLAGGWLADCLRAGRDPRIKYVIWDRQIMAGAGGPSPWVWRPYNGVNAHQHHVHVSVVADARALVRTDWRLKPSALTGVGAIPIVKEASDVELSDHIPDYYAAGRPDLSVRDTLAWATAHAAHARDWAQEAAERVDALATQVQRLGNGAVPQIDYDALAAALLRRMANPGQH
jgi:hypothetical protein